MVGYCGDELLFFSFSRWGGFFRLVVGFDRLWINGPQQQIDLFRSAVEKVYLSKPPR